MKNNLIPIGSIIPIDRNIFYNNIKLDNLNKSELDDLKDISSVLFQVITFLEMYRTYEGYVSLNIDLVIGQYDMKNTKRNRSSISKALKLLMQLGVIDILNIEDDILPEKFILIEVSYEKERFFSHNTNTVIALINTILEKDEKYIIGLVYYYICSKLDYDDMISGYRETQIYYSDMSKALGIKSNKTLQRYVEFLEDNNFIETSFNYEMDANGKVIERVSRDGKSFKNKVKLYSLPVS